MPRAQVEALVGDQAQCRVVADAVLAQGHHQRVGAALEVLDDRGAGARSRARRPCAGRPTSAPTTWRDDQGPLDVDAGVDAHDRRRGASAVASSAKVSPCVALDQGRPGERVGRRARLDRDAGRRRTGVDQEAVDDAAPRARRSRPGPGAKVETRRRRRAPGNGEAVQGELAQGRVAPHLVARRGQSLGREGLPRDATLRGVGS